MRGQERHSSNGKTLPFRPRQTKQPPVVLSPLCLSLSHLPGSTSISLIRTTKCSCAKFRVRECLWDRTRGFIWKCNVKDWQEVAYKSNKLLKGSPTPTQPATRPPGVWGTQAGRQAAQWTLPTCVGDTAVTRACHRKEKMPHTPSWILRNSQTGWKSQINADTLNWLKCTHTVITNDDKTETM